MIQIILLVAVLISVFLGLWRDYQTKKFYEGLEEWLRENADNESMYDDLAHFDNLEEYQRSLTQPIDDGSLFDIEL